jgi:hypothetical protein
MATKIIELDDYGYPGKTLSLRDPTGGDMVSVNEWMIKERKVKGEVNQMMASLVLLNKVIDEAPFDKSVDNLKTLPMRLLNMMDKEITAMINPLPKTSEETS